MGGTYGVEQLKKIVHAAAVLGNTIDRAVPIITTGDFFAKLKLLSLITDAMPAFATLASVDMNSVKNELGELDQADEDALVAEFKSTLSLNEAPLEATIESVLDVVAHATNLVQNLVAEVAKLIKFFKP